MSRTTDISISVGVLDAENLDQFNAAFIQAGFEASNGCPTFSSLSDWLRQLPGSKFFTGDIFAACWNHGDYQLPILLQAFRNFAWEEPETVVLLVTPEQEETQIYRPSSESSL